MFNAIIPCENVVQVEVCCMNVITVREAGQMFVL